ncbi:hypothetical protein Tco_0995719, partial [Tanacetum coccineum]
MSTYLKNIGGYKHKQLKSKSYEEIQKMFDNEMRRVNTFIPMDSEVVKSKNGIEEVLKDDDKAIDAIPLATKPLVIVDYKLHKEGIMLLKTKHGDIRPEDEHERVMWGDFKVMFKPDIRSKVWRDLQGYTVTVWKLYDSCGVHFV